MVIEAVIKYLTLSFISVIAFMMFNTYSIRQFMSELFELMYIIVHSKSSRRYC